MTQVTLQEAEGQLTRLIQIVRQGDEVIITSNSIPVAKLVSIPKEETLSKPRARFGSGKGIFRMSSDFDEPLEDFKEYME
jgi:prevent-host-death family protein